MEFQEIDEEVVISGIGCKLPESSSLEEFAEKLFSGQNLVTRDDRKLSQGLFENLPEYSGKVRDVRKFDYTFFGISNIVVQCMDPMTHQILERTFEAVMDAGINPCELRGTNTAVFSGTSISDFDLEWATNYKGGYGIMGRNRCMNANRVSYWLDLKGTSVSLDSTWANGLSNLQNGWECIKKGRCDTALISTANLQNNAEITIQLSDLGVLSPDGICRSFDDSANGYSRSDAVVVLVLQRASIARRCYATISHVFSKCFGHRENVLHKPLQEHWETIFREFYSQSKIDPNDICYLEGNGTGVKDEDTVELNAITNFFCKNRKSPLLIGSVKSNMGHAEAAAGSCGLIKALICLETGIIPSNLNLNTPNSACYGFQTGKLKLVNRNTSLAKDGLVAINAYGYGGVYAHMVLKANNRPKCLEFDGIPRLVLIADRTDESMDSVLNKIESMPFHPGYISLLNGIHSKKVDKYLSRGYTILPKTKKVAMHDHQVYNEVKRPLWYIFSGMGSQWRKMGERLMDLPVFRESIQKSHRVLEPKGLNLIKILTDDDPKIFDNILHSFVGIAAIQIALVDVLNVLGIVPDGMIGHSVGELGCAYADGCFTAEQMILSAYSRGRASIESDLIRGYMAAIGKGYNQIKDELPEGIEVACHNAVDSCTISGPAEMVQDYVKKLESSGVFARTVNVSNIAYHSKYIKPAAPKLLKYLKDVIPNPKLRSPKWISTSNAEENWDTELAKYCSAEYHTNNLLNSVLFEEGCKHIPSNAICLEIAPHGLLQAILKRSLGEGCINISLTHRTAEDPLMFLLQAIGKLYVIGLEPQISNLYPKVEYPVARGTPSIHQLIHWSHEVDLTIAQTRAEKKVIYSFKNHFLKTASDGLGYFINGKNTYPVSVFLHLIWNIYSSLKKLKTDKCPVLLENVRIECPMSIHPSKTDDAMITLQKGTGDFEINTTKLLARGTISLLTEKVSIDETFQLNDISYTMPKDEIYNEFLSKGYDMGENFKCLHSISFGKEGLRGEIDQGANWVQTMESLLQLEITQLAEEKESIIFPLSFEKIYIIPQQHLKYRASLDDSQKLIANYNTVLNVATCGGLKIKGFKVQELPLSKSNVKFISKEFAPFMNPPFKNPTKYIDFCFGLVVDNITSIAPEHVVNILEVLTDKNGISTGKYIEQNYSFTKMKVNYVSSVKEIQEKKIFDLIICSPSDLEKCSTLISEFGLILTSVVKNKENKIPVGMDVVSRFAAAGSNEEMLLIKKKIEFKEEPDFISIPKNESVLVNILRALTASDRPVYLIGYEEPERGMESYRRRMQSETSVPLRWIFILEENAALFDRANVFNWNQLKGGLVMNVFFKGTWGCFAQCNYVEDNEVGFFGVSKLEKEFTDCFLGLEFSKNYMESKKIEFSGRLKNNSRIMGISHVTKDGMIMRDNYFTWNLPESWTLEDGATVPVSYAFSYYAIVVIGKLKKFESLLVTDGSTPLGMAAIDVGLSIVPNVYVTVKNDDDAAFIRNRYPTLPKSNVICHGDKNFNIHLGDILKGDYPEMIINQLEGERLMSAVNCLRTYGRIFHFGSEDYKNNTQLGTSVFLLNTAFYSVTEELLLRLRNEEKQRVHDLVEEGIKNGIVKPLPRKVLAPEEFHKSISGLNDGVGSDKAILGLESLKWSGNKFCIDPEYSYLIIGDESDLWVNVLRWLTRRGARKVVVQHRSQGKSEQRHAELIRKYNVVICGEQKVNDVESVFAEAKKLGPISAVFLIGMRNSIPDKVVSDIDRLHRDRGGRLMVISKSADAANEICMRRNQCDLPSSSFVWGVEEMLMERYLEMMNKLCGRASAFRVSHSMKGDVDAGDGTDELLKKLLPVTTEDFCNLGSSLSEEVRIAELPSLVGAKLTEAKELSPVFFIGDLRNDPAKVFTPLTRQLMYPTLCVHVPFVKTSVTKLASFILPKILGVRKSAEVFNVVGVSWGCFVAIEITKQMEKMGKTVGLILIDYPTQSLRLSLSGTRTWESDLLQIIQGLSKRVPRDFSASDNTWAAKINRIMTTLELQEEEEESFRRAADFILHGLTAVLDYDVAGIKLLGPLTVIQSGQRPLDDSTISKMCNNISVRHIPLDHPKFMASKELREVILGSAVTESMSKSTVNQCTWRNLEDFLVQEKMNDFNSFKADFRVTTTGLKFSFTH